MKKAQRKQLQALIKTLPNIPILENGRTKTRTVWLSGEALLQEGIKNDAKGIPIDPKLFYNHHEVGTYVNKEKFFIECERQGMTAQQSVDLWNEKYKKVQELIAAYVPPTKEEKPEETEEEMKQRVEAEYNKQLRSKGWI